MTRPSFPEGVAVALVAALVGSIAYTLLPGLFGLEWTVRAMIAGLGLGYVLYLLKRSHERTGRVVTVAAWLLLASLSWLLVSDPFSYLTMHLGLIWLVRSLYHQPGPLAALADLAINLFALLSGLWAFLHTDSAFMAVWSFFLVQALFVAIPSARGRAAGTDAKKDQQPDSFQLAYHSAQLSLRKLSNLR